MRESTILNKVKTLSRNWKYQLLLITGIAIILRSLPAWTNAAWGCDFGIYYGITNSMVENGELFSQYNGWGLSYQYFPITYMITSLVHFITGVDVLVLMPKVVPIFGGLTIFVFYFLVRELTYSRKIAIMSSLFLAVIPFHVYQTSHASPLTMGHFFMVMSLLFFLKYRQNTKYIIPLFISTTLLIMSHHLSTYFFLISIIFIVFVENASRKKWTDHIQKDTFFIFATTSMMFSYWVFVATPVYEEFMRFGVRIGSLMIGSYYLIIIFYVLICLMYVLVWLKRKYNIFTEKQKSTPEDCLLKFMLTMAVCLVAMAVFTFIEMPWTSFSFTPLSILYSIPLLLTISFGVAGFRQTRFTRNGLFIRGWIFGLAASFVFSLVTNSRVFYPHRHIEYLMIPLSIIAVYGLRGILLNYNQGTLSKIKTKIPKFNLDFLHNPDKKWFNRRQIIYLLIIVALVSFNAVSTYPSHVALNASYEAITDDNLSISEWIDLNLDKKTTLIASDHRIARITEAVGFNTTLDQAIKIFNAIEITEYLDELYGIDKIYNTKITHVIIDDTMKNRVVHVGFGEITYMTNESYNKFQRQPYSLIYRTTTNDPNTNEILHWTEIYEINWEYIEENYKI